MRLAWGGCPKRRLKVRLKWALSANPDLWWAPNEKTGTAIAGRILVAATRGEGDPHDINGTYTVEWGIPLTREGKLSAVLEGDHPTLRVFRRKMI